MISAWSIPFFVRFSVRQQRVVSSPASGGGRIGDSPHPAAASGRAANRFDHPSGGEFAHGNAHGAPVFGWKQYGSRIHGRAGLVIE
ncbi:MAG: hypothetical protein RBS80_01945 [Thermoguttaceae bacterium]|nr:hypothetical protein [Thermoguttaceae bacterium]